MSADSLNDLGLNSGEMTCCLLKLVSQQNLNVLSYVDDNHKNLVNEFFAIYEEFATRYTSSITTLTTISIARWIFTTNKIEKNRMFF